MGNGRWGGRASPHGRDVGQSYQGETIQGFSPSAGMRGSLGTENDGEGLPKFTPKEGGSLNKEALGEKRNSGNSKPLGDPKHVQSGFNPSKSGGEGPGASGSKPPGEPGVGGKQFNSKGSPGNMVSAKDREPKTVKDGGPGSGPQGGKNSWVGPTQAETNPEAAKAGPKPKSPEQRKLDESNSRGRAWGVDRHRRPARAQRIG